GASASGTGWTCNPPSSGQITCTRATLAPGSAPAITLTATAPSQGGTITNSASVNANTTDPNSANNTESEDTTVTASGASGADLAIGKTDGPDPVQAGLVLTYTLSVVNGGPDSASAVTATDTLPSGVTFVSAQGQGWACSVLNSTVTCRLTSLPPGPAAPISIVVRAPGTEGTIQNRATVASGAPDPDSSNNSALADTQVTAVYDLAVVRIHTSRNVKFPKRVTTVSDRVRVQIQNRGPHPETIPDLATLGNLVRLQVQSLGPCAAPTPVLLSGPPQLALPQTIPPKGLVHVWFGITYSSSCVNDPEKSLRSDPAHDDYTLTASVNHSALDGKIDLHTADDVCPRSVIPPFELDPYPDGTIQDKGCGAQKGNGTLGDPVAVDLILRK
ncbi:MAG: DUF11 domain-containing protein, partial [Acidobacteria bacterium]|nr:DUF11 domain-containing protein [Acidobacteriota bacterium]